MFFYAIVIIVPCSDQKCFEARADQGHVSTEKKVFFLIKKNQFRKERKKLNHHDLKRKEYIYILWVETINWDKSDHYF